MSNLNLKEYLTLISEKDQDTPVNSDDINELSEIILMIEQSGYTKKIEDLKLKELMSDLDLKYKDLQKPLNKLLAYLDPREFKNPLATPVYNHKNAIEVSEKIKKYGLYDYLDYWINKMRIGNNKNIIRKIIASFSIIRGQGRYFIETTAQSEEGKSLEDEIAFLQATPQEYIFKMNNMSIAYFTRCDKYFFDRKIVYYGDLGGKKSYLTNQDVFDECKKLITEKETSRGITEQVGNTHEQTNLELAVNSMGVVYQTVKNSFTEDDTQLESRTIHFTPMQTNLDDVLKFIFMNNTYNKSETHKEKERALKELERFQDYLRMLINKDMSVINPYERIFIDYAKTSDNPKRELTQQMELFESYCIMSYMDCNTKYKELVASQKQLENYFYSIALENALIPYENEFLKMIMAKGKKYELKIIEDDTDLETSELTPYFNDIFEDMQETQRNLYEYNYLTFEDLEPKQELIFIKKLIQVYGLRSRNTKHKENIFFTYNHLKALYGKYSDYKNIDDVSILLNKLYNTGYLNKLEFKRNNQNIYYLTSKCKELDKQIKLSKKDIIKANELLNDFGLI